MSQLELNCTGLCWNL